MARALGARDPGVPAAWPCAGSLLLREFRSEDGRAVIPLGTTVQGDVLLVIYHARSTLGGRLQAKVSAMGGEPQLAAGCLGSAGQGSASLLVGLP